MVREIEKWEQAKEATMKIAPFACQADPDGITLYLFNGMRYKEIQIEIRR